MAIAKITSEGLGAIAFAVALLWGCVIAQHSLAEKAYAERIQVLKNSPHFDTRPRTLPVSAPSPHTTPRVIAAEG